MQPESAQVPFLPSRTSFCQLAARGLLGSVSVGTVAIVLICMAVMFVTLLVVERGIAIEANPLLSWTFQFGPVYFALVKTISFIPGVWALEMCRIQNARFAAWASRAAVYGYFAVYFLGSIRIHG